MDSIIFGVHVAVLLVGILAPFLAGRRGLLLYTLVIPFLFFHWAVNDDTCALTQLECLVTNQPKERTFMGRVIGPIYNMSDDNIGKATKLTFFVLWTIVQWRLGLFKELMNK